jgi:hypothetical protein
VRAGALAGFLLHALAVGWAWRSWELGLRSGVIVWMDFPLSLLYLGAPGRQLLVWSVVVGGLWWAAIGALLTHWIGRVAATPRPPRRRASDRRR